MKPLDAARKLTEAGISVIPIKPDGSKSPTVPWKEFQSRIALPDELSNLFKGYVGIAVIAGAISGGLEVIDIEAEAPMADLVQLIDEHLPGLLPTLPQVNTPTGGRHILYRCSEVAGNQKLAMSVESKVLIETRGEGGYVLTVTSPPECHPSGKEYTLAVGSILRTPTITPEQRDILLACCRSFNRLVVAEHVPVSPRGTGKTPGDDFNARGDGLSILLTHGWQIASRRNGHAYLRRPGKKSGISATYGYVAPGVLNNFSSNAAPFALGAFDNFGIFARLEADGDFSKAAKLLREQGYGEAVSPSPVRNVAPVAVADPPAVRELTDLELAEQQTILTESNVAMVFEHKYKNLLRYCHSWGEWLVWTGTHWRPDRTLLAHDYSASLCRRLNPEMKQAPAKSSFARGVEFLSRSKRVFATETADWDSDNYLFNTPGGTLNLRTGELRQHAPEDHLTQCSSVFPSDAPRPIFDRFLRDITLEDAALAVYLQTALGACLSGAIEDNFLLFLFGSGQNGKNCFGDLIQKIMGSYAVTINADTLMAPRGGSAQHLTFIADLRGKRLALSSEVEEGSYFNESRLKSLTGDAILKANRMRQDPFEFKKTHHHVIYGNHRPLLRIVDEGMKARLHMVPFKAHFPPDGRDPEMAAKLATEAPQVLQWLIDGHELWMEAGKVLRKCSAVQAETESYFQAQSTTEMWLTECCLEVDTARCQARELYHSFKAWKESRGEGVMSQTRWGEWMSSRFNRLKSNGSIVYSGIDLKPQSILNFQA